MNWKASKKCCSHLLALAVLLVLPVASRALDIVIDQRTGIQTVNGLTELAKGETVKITINNTSPRCFSYNAEQVAATKTGLLGGASLPPLETVVLETTHQRGTTAYTVRIDEVKEPSPGCKEQYKTLSDRRAWTISVSTIGWGIDFSGGLVIDGLTDRKYALQPAAASQFTVVRDSGAEDKTNQRLGVFAHLVNSAWERNRSVTWVPVSVGIGMDDNTRFMLGTGLKAGDQWYMTIGRVFGKVAALPVGVSEGTSTMDQNILATMGQKSEASWFISVTFSFGGTASKSAFQGLFSPPVKKDGTQQPSEAGAQKPAPPGTVTQ